jgi:hypothetical protein
MAYSIVYKHIQSLMKSFQGYDSTGATTFSIMAHIITARNIMTHSIITASIMIKNTNNQHNETIFLVSRFLLLC